MAEGRAPTGLAVHAFKTGAEHGRRSGQQAVLARGEGLFHHRIDLGQPRQLGRNLHQLVAQAAAQAPGGGLDGLLQYPVTLAQRGEVGCSGGFGQVQQALGFGILTYRGQQAGVRLRAVGQHILDRLGGLTRLGQASAERPGQGHGTAPVHPLAEAIGQGGTAGRHRAVAETGEQAEELRSTQDRLRCVRHQGVRGQKPLILQPDDPAWMKAGPGRGPAGATRLRMTGCTHPVRPRSTQ